MYKSILLLAFYYLLPLPTTAQEIKWVKSTGGSNGNTVLRSNQGEGICIDGSGNVYVCGYTQGIFKFGQDSINSYTDNRSVLVKYGPDGKELWARMVTHGASDYAYGVCVDAKGNIAVVGLTAGMGLETFAAQYTADGNLNWLRKSQSDGSDSRGHAVAADDKGNIYMVGESKGAVQFGDVQIGAKDKYEVFVVKYDAQGNVVWVRNTAPSDSYETKGECVATDGKGKIYVGGEFTKSISMAGKQAAGKGGADVFIARIAESGAVEWLQVWGGDKKDRIHGLAVDSKGEIAAAMNFVGRSNINGQSVIGERLIKLNGAAGLLWQKEIGIPRTDYSIKTQLAVDANGDIYLAGHIYGAIPLLGMQSAYSSGGSDIFIAKCNARGERQWMVQAGGAGIDEGSAICIDKEGNAYVTGIFNRKCTFGSQTIESISKEDGIFVAKVK